MIWTGCYNSSWKGVITDEAFAHPAKFSRDLLEHIYRHCLARGYLNRGDTVGDPFGGVATGGIIGAYCGFKWIGVELEQKFASLARRNFALHKRHWLQLGHPRPIIVKGDSRKFDKIVAMVDTVVSSPPYAEGLSKEHTYSDHDKRIASSHRNIMREKGIRDPLYGHEPGQIGALKTGSVDAIVSSPPYAAIAAGAGGLNTKPAKHPGQQTGRSASPSQSGNWSKELLRYGKTDGQISQLKSGTVDAVVSSPPYENRDLTGQRNFKSRFQPDEKEARANPHEGYSVDAVVTSPPWEANAEGQRKASKFKNTAAILKGNRGHGASDKAVLAQAARDQKKTYGSSAGQIGQLKAETYWEAVAQVYAACYRAIKPGGVIVLVVKDYVKQGKRVPLCDDTARLLDHCGFTMVERIHAMLTTDTHHADLFEGTVKETKSRKSFFRRMAEAKGSPPIDFEEVLIARKP